MGTNASAARVRFTEEMAGHVAFGESDFERGQTRGRATKTSLRFHLTIETPALDEFVSDPGHEAEAVGWVHCDALGGRRPVERGRFNLFVPTADPNERQMRYRLHVRDGVGTPLTLVGHKVIADDPGFDLWPDTTTLFTRLLSGHVEADADEEAPSVAVGILRITPLSFARQLTTFRARGAGAVGNIAALARFDRLFLGELWRIYGRPRRERSPS
jgi:cholesterol oxidase